MKKHLSSIIRLGILVILIILLIILSILKNDPEICEAMTRGFSRNYGAFFSKISGVIPFSLTELSFVLLVAGIIALLVFAIIGLVKKKYVASINRAIEIAALIFLSLDFYNLSCEFSYNRKELPLPYYQERVMRTEHLPIFNYYADDINASLPVRNTHTADHIPGILMHQIIQRLSDFTQSMSGEAWSICNPQFAADATLSALSSMKIVSFGFAFSVRIAVLKISGSGFCKWSS